jgi:hypothetical protein
VPILTLVPSPPFLLDRDGAAVVLEMQRMQRSRHGECVWWREPTERLSEILSSQRHATETAIHSKETAF